MKTVKSLRLCTNCLRKGHFYGIANHQNAKPVEILIIHFYITMLIILETIYKKQLSLKFLYEQQTSIQRKHRPLGRFCYLQRKFLYLTNKVINICSSIARALLDSASQSNFITQKLVDKLGLKTENINMSVSGITQGILALKHKTNLIFGSKHIDYTSHLSCFILDKITEDLPHLSFR